MNIHCIKRNLWDVFKEHNGYLRTRNRLMLLCCSLHDIIIHSHWFFFKKLSTARIFHHPVEKQQLHSFATLAPLSPDMIFPWAVHWGIFVLKKHHKTLVGNIPPAGTHSSCGDNILSWIPEAKQKQYCCQLFVANSFLYPSPSLFCTINHK